MPASTQADILRKILQQKHQEIALKKQVISLQKLQQQCETLPACRGFLRAIEQRVQSGQTAVIAEIKRASPSKGILRRDFVPAEIALDYAQAGAQCLSVLTDQAFFQGSLQDLVQARQACSLPVLRKDFIIDAYQIYEARAAGADCILLIVAALDDASLQAYAKLAMQIGMDVLVECHDAQEISRALQTKAVLIGINNRDLHNFVTRIETTLELRPLIPNDRLVVTESGIHQAEQVNLLYAHGVAVFLVGEAFMLAKRPGLALQQLFPQREP